MRNTIVNKLCLSLAIVMAAPMPITATAATSNTSISVGSNVLAACIVLGSSIAFGTYSTTQVDQSSNITVLCTYGTSYNVGLDAGSGTGATTSVRKMTGVAGGHLNYALYRNSGRTQLWGNTIGTDTLPATGSGLFQSITVYGRIPAAQTPAADTYSDTVTITLTY